MGRIKESVFKTFLQSSPNGVRFEENLKKLLSLMDTLTAEDVNLNRDLLNGHRLAPVTYVEILKHPDYIINMFVLRPGNKLPLHDHPMMHGICKVVSGNVIIRNYSLTEEESASAIGSERVLTIKEPDRRVNERDGAVLLTPRIGNIHEIKAIDGGAAFVDVLAPPYLSYIEGVGRRTCNYFKEAGEKEGYTELVKIEKDPEYWTDVSPYLGS